MKKKIVKYSIIVACVATIIVSLVAVPCSALVSNSSIINKTCINLQSVVYTDNEMLYNYNVSGFDYGTPKSGLDNSLTTILYSINDEGTGYIGIQNLATYFDKYASFQLLPKINGTSDLAPYFYPRVYYFGESYMPIGVNDTWGQIIFNYDVSVALDDIAEEQIFVSVTYQTPIYEEGQVTGFRSTTDYGTFNMTNENRRQVVDIKNIFNKVCSTAIRTNIVHIQSLKFTRVSTNDLLPCSSTQFTNLEYFSSDGDDLSPYATLFQDYLTNNIQLRDLDVDFTSWLPKAIGGFLNFELIQGLSLWEIFLGIFGIMVTLAFLKYFAGG